MAKSRDQKKKLLYVYKILAEDTDENHPMNTSQIIDELAKYDIDAERKSIYTDIEALEDIGCDIINKKTRPAGYYMASRDFEEVELKLLVDTVQSSKFITQNQSKRIIGKLKTLTNKFNAAKLEQRNVNISEPLKQTNSKSYNTVDAIHDAIHSNKAISFQYHDWNIKGQYLPRHNGKVYNVSPYSLTFDSDKYYLIAFEHESQGVRNYRVDKIEKIQILEEDRDGKDEFKNFDLPKYNHQTFGMFNGEVDNVVIQFEEKLCGVMVDRFGTNPVMRPLMEGDKYYQVLDAQINIQVSVSKQFYGWLAGLDGRVVITSPNRYKVEFQEHLESILELHKVK